MLLTITKPSNLGKVLIITEGQTDEFECFKHIFTNLLGYPIITHRRRCAKCLDAFAEFRPNQPKSPYAHNPTDIIIATSKSQSARTILKDQAYRDELYKTIYDKFGVDVTNYRTYFVWDRDPESNPQDIFKTIVDTFYDPLDNTPDNFTSGLLIPSYRQIEAYLLSNFHDVKFAKKNLKNFVYHDLKLSHAYKKITNQSILKAAAQMLDRLELLGLNPEALQNLQTKNTKSCNPQKPYKTLNRDLFSQEEAIYQKTGEQGYAEYLLLSLISLILLDLGIITLEPEE